MDYSEFWTIAGWTSLVVVIFIGGIAGVNYLKKSDQRYLTAPLPKERKKSVIESLEKIYRASWCREQGGWADASHHLRDIDHDIRRYYRALEALGRKSDINMVFAKLETFANTTATNYTVLAENNRYADPEMAQLLMKRIKDFKDYAFSVAERAVAEQIAGTTGKIELQELVDSDERELEALETHAGNKAEQRGPQKWLSEARTALVRRVP